MTEPAASQPGILIAEMATASQSVVPVPATVPAFVGYTQFAPGEKDRLWKDVIPVRVSGLQEFERQFGGAENETTISVGITTAATGDPVSAVASISAPSKYNMFYALRHYFDNGGGPCYIVSVGPFSPAGIRFADLSAGLVALAGCQEPTLCVFPEGTALPAAEEYYRLIGNVLAQCTQLKDRFTLVDLFDQSGDTATNMARFRSADLGAGMLYYGAAYYPNLKTAYAYQFLDADVPVTLHPPAPATPATHTLSDLAARNPLVYAAAKAAIQDLHPVLPPSPAIAGIYAAVDSAHGVWKAPANVPLTAVTSVSDIITDASQEMMTGDPGPGRSVNPIRSFPGKGILVWGARTLDGNNNEWKYVSVRRFFIAVETSLKIALLPFVFEPNDENTWMRIRTMFGNYLFSLWRLGALAGPKPEQAYWVRCGLGDTMTAQDILDGRLVVDVGLAPVRPAEFIELCLSQIMQLP